MEQKVRITRPIISHLEGSDAWQFPNDPERCHYPSSTLMAKIKEAKTGKDGSVTVMLNTDERDDLQLYVEVQRIGAQDNIIPPRELYAGCYNSLGEFNACNAMLRQLRKLQ